MPNVIDGIKTNLIESCQLKMNQYTQQDDPTNLAD